METHSQKHVDIQTATFAGGCFWCTEAIFKRLKGVISVMSGYSGGERENPTYDQIHSDATGHAEAIQIMFDSKVISFDKLVDIFFATHNPTTLNQQGADTGSEYRSAIFYHDQDQKKIAEEKILEVEKSGKYKDPVVTEVTPFTNFYKAEWYHQNFYENNRYSPYCMFVIDPKVQKLLKEFGKDVKEEFKK